MNAELEKLIDLALADGQLTEKEKQILTRKAKEFGVDEDEFEMVLEGKLHLAQKAMNQSNTPQAQQTQEAQKQSNKEGALKKCPSCGAPAQAFVTKCPDCGHEFRNVQASSSVQRLFEMLNELEGTRRESSALGGLNNVFGQAFGLKNKTESRKHELISNFPVPNTKEDILEFLALALPKAKKMGLFAANGIVRQAHNEMAEIWRGKCQQIIMKARFAMKDDKRTLDEIEYYAKEIGIK